MNTKQNKKANYFHLDPGKKLVSLDLWQKSPQKHGQPKE